MKKILSVFVAVTYIIAAAAALCLPLSVSAESFYIRKIVSVVYDDSGSMEGDKWAYANYAMQAFCGMLNSEDQLFITYMSHTQQNSNYQPESIDLSSGGIQNSVDSIRNHADSGSTPYNAVQIAYDKLKSVSDSNPNTQYWLVVITDGAFDECNSMSYEEEKNFLNENFKNYADETMPNGTTAQVTFLAIGDAVISPDENTDYGIYTYHAQNADEITGAMSDMADRVSGRTRLEKSDIKKLNDNTIQVTSAIPLLNIAVFTQESNAQITGAVYDNEVELLKSRKVTLNYPPYDDLTGSAYLLGDSQNVIGAGTYQISFDQVVDLDDLVVLFEPALEIKMTILLNGQEITDFSELDQAAEGDTISVSCKICEMGTDVEIDPSLLPPNTDYTITVWEDNNVVQQSSGAEMVLSDYVLKDVETEITAAVTIDGFRPIDTTISFVPLDYASKADYSIVSHFGSDVQSVKLSTISSNQDLRICFTIYANGMALTDVDAVKALNPVITVSPQGNDGTISYSDDGEIIFIPNTASAPASNLDRFDVQVTCTIDNGASAAESYTVLVSDYQVVPIAATGTIKKTGFYGNQVSASFYITKDGVQLDRAAVGQSLSITLNEAYRNLKTNVDVAEDGTITVTPYSDQQHNLTFWNWWINWWYYWGLPGDDLSVTLNHPYGSGQSTIDVVEESIWYQLGNVYLPLLIELAALAFLITWIVLLITKPKYLKSAKLYVGEIKYNREHYTHMVRCFSCVRLEKFNKIRKGNGRLKFKKTADVVSANGIRIRADRGGRIICEMPFPWYKGVVIPKNRDLKDLRTPADLFLYFTNHPKLEINQFVTTETVDGKHNRSLTPANPNNAKYFVVPDAGNGVTVVDHHKVIQSGKIFIYING